jgi:hypothetical protein
MRTGALPARGRSVVPLLQMAPRQEKSTRGRCSNP